jgi:hypothetical protein
MGTALPRRARFTTDEALIEFTRRAGGPKTLEDRNILDMMIQKKSGEITLELTDEQYQIEEVEWRSCPIVHKLRERGVGLGRSSRRGPSHMQALVCVVRFRTSRHSHGIVPEFIPTTRLRGEFRLIATPRQDRRV